ncbi:MAG: prepilin-type N-terminal cleavage/methylation domain-containing protein [Oleispira sp.]
MKIDHKQNKGFTLIELMIVIAIIGILVSIVLPGYRSYVLESQRTDTQGKLLQMVELQERFFIDNFRYTTSLGGNPAVEGDGLDYPLANVNDPVIISYSGEPAFSIQVLACNLAVPTGLAALYLDIPDITRCFRLVATPLGDQVNDGALILDSRGRKVLDYASIYPRDWNNNDLGTTPALSQAACPECAAFPDRDDQ